MWCSIHSYSETGSRVMELPVCSNINWACEICSVGRLEDKGTMEMSRGYNKDVYLEVAVHADITFTVAEVALWKLIEMCWPGCLRYLPQCSLMTWGRSSLLLWIFQTWPLISSLWLWRSQTWPLMVWSCFCFCSIYTTKDNTDVGVPELNSAIDQHFKEFHAAVKKYKVGNVLRSLYASALARNLNPDNCWIYMKQSYYGYGQRAYGTCYKYITANYNDVIKSSSFLDAMKLDPEGLWYMVKLASALGIGNPKKKRLRTDD